MRWIVVTALLALFSAGSSATDSFISADHQGTDGASVGAVPDAVATVTAIPSHSMAAELVKELSPHPVVRPIKKLRVAKKKSLPKSLLSRTERHQLALMVARPKTATNEALVLDLLNDDDAGSGYGDLDLQRFYSRPKVVKVADRDDDRDDDELSDAVKLRLLLIRMQALRAQERNFPQA